MIFCDDDEKFFFFEPAKLLFLLFSVFAGLDFNYLLSDFIFLGKWRRVRDSNPRALRRAASFQDWCIQPLYQLSVVRFIGLALRYQGLVNLMRGVICEFLLCHPYMVEELAEFLRCHLLVDSFRVSQGVFFLRPNQNHSGYGQIAFYLENF